MKPTPVFLPGESHGQRSLGRRSLQSTGSQRAGHDSNDVTAAKQDISMGGSTGSQRAGHDSNDVTAAKRDISVGG